MGRRTVFWVVLGVAGAVVVAVIGVLVAAWANGDQLVGGGRGSYLVVFALVFGDAILPLLPGETTLNTASVLASQGKLDIELVILAGALGAILGDSALYWIARTGPTGLKARLQAASRDDKRVAKGLELLDRSGPLLIALGRFVPGVRFAVNVSMGLVEYPYGRFLLWSAVGGAAWSVYTCLLAYWVGGALEDFPLASIVISGLITTVLIAGVYWLDRRRGAGGSTASPSTAPAP